MLLGFGGITEPERCEDNRKAPLGDPTLLSVSDYSKHSVPSARNTDFPVQMTESQQAPSDQ